MRFMRAASAAQGVGALILALALTLLSATSAAANGQHAGASKRLLVPSAGWHGRPIEEPHRHELVRVREADVPLRGWSAGPVAFGAGYHRAGGSARVREIQKGLRRLGYHPGPIDGRFRPRTRAAVAWFQTKHGLPVNGRATLPTVWHLRSRTGTRPGGAADASDDRLIAAQQKRQRESSQAQPRTGSDAVIGPVSAGGGEQRDSLASPFTWIAAVSVALAALALLARIVTSRRGSAPAQRRENPREVHAVANWNDQQPPVPPTETDRTTSREVAHAGDHAEPREAHHA
jgi:peptidoglycan hydrolase-like protein with peptidoglycan-binding domain